MKISLTKMLRDMWIYKGRTILTFIGVLIGIAAVGAVLAAYAILTREMNRNYMGTNPASIVFNVANLDEGAEKIIRETYPKTDVEVRKTIQARVGRGNGTFGTIYLRAVQDFRKLQVDTFTLEKGSFPAKASEMVLERDCLKILPNLNRGVGQSLHLKLPGGGERDLRLSGIVHAPGLSPASMENISYAFLSLEGLKTIGYQGWYDEIRIVCHQNRFNRSLLRKSAQDMKKTLLKKGYLVTRVDVPEPGKHPHAGQLASILFLLQSFAVIALLVACIIIINLLNFIMSKQVKQIAVMKAVGAGTGDIAPPYFGYVLLISMAALVFSIPLAMAAGSGYSDFAAGILNFKIASYTVPYWVFIIQALTGLLVPLFSAAYPILKSCAKSVKDGLSETTDNAMEMNRKGAYLKKILFGANSKLMIPINNLIRKRSRTLLAILALTAGGALFMTSQNIVASIDKTVAVSFKAFHWDYDIRLARDYPEERLKKVLRQIGGLDRIEIWKGNTVLLKKQDGTDSAYYPIKIMPEGSRMVNLSISDGLELENYQDAIVVNKILADDENWLKPGMTTTLAMDGKTAPVVVAGIVNEVPALPAVYMGIKTYQKYFGGRSRQIILAGAKTRDPDKQRQITKDLEARFKSAGIELAENWNIFIFRNAFVNHLHVIVTLLAIIAMLAVVVGGLSIASAIGISVSERKREIGILRAVGVNRHQIIAMVSTEVFLMGMAGWLVGVVLSYPVSVWVGNYFGQIFLHTDLQNVLSMQGAVQWLVISITVSFVSGFLPALQVATAPLKEMLAYE